MTIDIFSTFCFVLVKSFPVNAIFLRVPGRIQAMVSFAGVFIGFYRICEFRLFCVPLLSRLRVDNNFFNITIRNLSGFLGHA